MSHHPERLRRPFGSYDPDEPMVIPYADLIAALNAASVLTTLLQDEHTPLGEYHVQVAQHHLGCAVSPDGADDFLPSQEAAASFARDLRDRLRSYLPRPNPGVQS